MSFVDSLMDMLKNGKEEDGAATARNNLSQTWDYSCTVRLWCHVHCGEEA